MVRGAGFELASDVAKSRGAEFRRNGNGNKGLFPALPMR